MRPMPHRSFHPIVIMQTLSHPQPWTPAWRPFSQCWCGRAVLAASAVVLSSIAGAGERIELGRLMTGASVSFISDGAGGWGIEVGGPGLPPIAQRKPARLEICRTESDIEQLAAGYNTVEKTSDGVEARATVAYGEKVRFQFHDRWRLDGSVASIQRVVEVTGEAPGGFDSAIVFEIAAPTNWRDVDCFAPGALYGDPTYDGERSVGGTLNYAARRFWMREDMLPAPVFALRFHTGNSVAILDPEPRGDSTVNETKLSETVVIDRRFQFGALGAW